MDERITKIIEKPMFGTICIGVSSFAVGVSLGYILGKKHKKVMHVVPPMSDFDTKMFADIQIMKERQKREKEEAQNKEYVVEDINGDEIRVDAEGNMISDVPPAGDDTESVMFIPVDPVDPDWDYEVEIPKRTKTEPYVIHRDEFYNQEAEDYDQTTVTYYAGDDILADQEQEAPIYNYVNVIGPLKFGHGSGDPNVFHVRNDKLKGEYEVVYDPGLYSIEVLGLQLEDNARAQDLKHSGPGHRKFKLE